MSGQTWVNLGLIGLSDVYWTVSGDQVGRWLKILLSGNRCGALAKNHQMSDVHQTMSVVLGHQQLHTVQRSAARSTPTTLAR
jgi:hypothetical protein